MNIDTKLRPNSDKTYVKLNEVIIRPSCNHEGMIPNSDQSYVKRKEVIIRINQKFPNFQLFIIIWENSEILNIDNSDKTYVKLNEVIIRPSCNHEGMIPNSDQSYVKRKEVIIRINQKFPNFQLFIIIWENSEILNIDNSDKT